jgi:D-glycero-beta-D-manno-heptose 1-phosphate adenylyltransferase
MGRVADLETVAAALCEARGLGLKVALANGAFDLLHVGHIRYLKGARALADLLVVAVNSDESVRRLKGPSRPAMPEGERAEIVAALEGVDWVVIFGEETPRAVIERLRPDLQVKGRDYTPDSVPEGEFVRSYGGRVVIAGDPKDHSTTSLLERLREKRR